MVEESGPVTLELEETTATASPTGPASAPASCGAANVGSARVGRCAGLLRRLAVVVPVLLPLLVLIATGLQGIDFGRHWDEGLSQLDPARRSLKIGVFLPGIYHYPSFDYWLTLVGALPDVVASLSSGRHTELELREYLSRSADSPEYTLRVRTIFLAVSALSLLWVYLLVLGWGRHWAEAMLAASALGLSWEVAYHLRWIAPDGVLMQFSALTLLAVLQAWRRPDRREWLWLDGQLAGGSMKADEPNDFEVKVQLPAGRHPIRIDYSQSGRVDPMEHERARGINLRWIPPGQAPKLVPPELLRPPAS